MQVDGSGFLGHTPVDGYGGFRVDGTVGPCLVDHRQIGGSVNHRPDGPPSLSLRLEQRAKTRFDSTLCTHCYVHHLSLNPQKHLFKRFFSPFQTRKIPGSATATAAKPRRKRSVKRPDVRPDLVGVLGAEPKNGPSGKTRAFHRPGRRSGGSFFGSISEWTAKAGLDPKASPETWSSHRWGWPCPRRTT